MICYNPDCKAEHGLVFLDEIGRQLSCSGNDFYYVVRYVCPECGELSEDTE